MTHESTIGYVRKNHLGDWQPYIAKWEGELLKLTTLHDWHAGAVLKSTGVKLRDEDLGLYIMAVAQRVAIVHCLANSQNRKDTGSVCPPFPDVPWWQNLTHDRVIHHVARQYVGDWQSYIARWEGELAKLAKIHQLNTTAILRAIGVELRNEDLGLYIAAVAQRVAITLCLANETKFE